MPKVNFKFDKEKDLYNIWQTCNYDSDLDDFKKSVNPKILEICEGKEFEECREELEDYRDKFYRSQYPEHCVEFFQKAWDKINDEYFRRLEKITGKKFPFEKVDAYITSVGRCPYNPKKENPFFMVSVFFDILKAMMVAGHETMHLHFHNTHWPEIEEKIGKEKTFDLKEALTVLLNIEFKDLWFYMDPGYSSHKELRDFISKTWNEKKDFDHLMDKCVEYLK